MSLLFNEPATETRAGFSLALKHYTKGSCTLAKLIVDIAFLPFLGQATQIEIILSLSHRPRWLRQVQK
jgi:hypothetical protein